MGQTQYVYGPQRGRIGNVVARRWRGRNVQQIWQRDVHNPNTLAQRLVRERFRVASEMFSPLTPFINIGMRNASDNAGRFGLSITPSNMAMRENFDNGTFTFSDSTDPSTLTVDYTRLMLSKGNGINPTGISVTADSSTQTATVTWTDNTSQIGQFGGASDVIMIAIYNEDRKQAIISSFDQFERRDQSASLTYPAIWQGNTIQTFLFACSPDAQFQTGSDILVAPTAYIGAVTA